MFLPVTTVRGATVRNPGTSMLVTAALLLTACSSTTSPVEATSPTATGTSSATAPAPTDGGSPTDRVTDHPYDDRVGAVVPVGSMVRGIAVVDGLVWAALPRRGEVVAVDAATHEVAARLTGLALPVTMVAGSAGELWVADLDGDATGASTELVRVDTTSRELGQRVPVPAFHAIPVVGDGAWALGPDATVRRVELDSGVVTVEHGVPAGTNWITADAEAVWGTTEGGLAWRLDPVEGSLAWEVDLGVEVPGRSRVAVGDGRFSVAREGRVIALDAATGEAVMDLDLPDLQRVNDLDPFEDGVLLSGVERPPTSASGEGRLWHLGPDGGVLDSWRLGPEPSEVVVDGDTLWIGDQETGEVLSIELG